MKADDRRHGTYSGAQQHRREDEPMCPLCHAAFRAYQRRHSKDRNMGRARTMPSAPVTAHLKMLVANGMTTVSIAQASGVGRSTIQDLISRPRPKVRVDNAQALLGIAPAGLPTGTVPSIGTIRRVKALGRLGWSMNAIVATAKQLDPSLPVTYGTLRQLLHDNPPVVRYRTATAVALAFGELAMRLPDHDRQSSQVRNRAERKGWLPPLAYEDIDDPNDVPSDWAYLPADRATAIRELAEQGENATHIARRLDMTPRALERWCQRHMPDTWRLIVTREGDWNSTGNLGHQSRRGDAA